MIIIKKKIVKGCKQGVIAYNICVDKTISKEMLAQLSQVAKLEYLSEFSPFYSLTYVGQFILKGMVGKKTHRLICYHKNTDFIWALFYRLFSPL